MERVASMRSLDRGGLGRRRMSQSEVSPGERRDAVSVHETASDTSSMQERKFTAKLGAAAYDASVAGGSSPLGAYVVPANVGHRLYISGTSKEQERQSRLRAQRERLLMLEMSQVTRRPNITHRARSKPAKGALFSDHSALWEKRRDDHRRALLRAEQERRLAEVTASPAINPASQRILDEGGHYRDPVTGWDEHFARYVAKRTAALPPEMFSPNINANAVRPDADRDIADRLFGDSYDRRERLRSEAQRRLREETIDPATGRPFFTPQSARPDAPGRGAGVFDALHDNSKEWQARRNAPVDTHEPALTFTPKVNPRSAELSEKSRKPLYTPNKTPRAADGASPSALSASCGGGGASGASAASPERRAAQPIDLQEFFRRAARDGQVRQARMKALRDEYSSRDRSDCTFHPRVNEHSLELFVQMSHFGTEGAAGVGGVGVVGGSSAGRGVAGTPRAGGSPRSPRGGGGGGTASASATARSGGAPPTPGGNGDSARRLRRPPAAVSPAGASARGAAGRRAGSPREGGEAADYIASFEKQMAAVLDEWKRLEEV